MAVPALTAHLSIGSHGQLPLGLHFSVSDNLAGDVLLQDGTMVRGFERVTILGAIGADSLTGGCARRQPGGPVGQ
jgi:hypothetical protein